MQFMKSQCSRLYLHFTWTGSKTFRKVSAIALLRDQIYNTHVQAPMLLQLQLTSNSIWVFLLVMALYLTTMFSYSYSFKEKKRVRQNLWPKERKITLTCKIKKYLKTGIVFVLSFFIFKNNKTWFHLNSWWELESSSIQSRLARYIFIYVFVISFTFRKDYDIATKKNCCLLFFFYFFLQL